MKQIIVTTTINPPTEAIRKFDAMPDWHLIVVGDARTPDGYKLERGTYLSPGTQSLFDRKLSELLGWNCIQRRNIGLLVAYEMGADVIATVDDDNFPMQGWGEDLLLGRAVKTKHFEEKKRLAFEPIQAAGARTLWHRGYPIQWLSSWTVPRHEETEGQFDIQADFWNEDPDIDAICRMMPGNQAHWYFDGNDFPMSANVMSPFNSQNTFLTREVLRDYFLFPGIGRMDDIWASYYVQAKGRRVVYGKPSVVQHRNPHDLTEDFKNEWLGYTQNYKLIPDLIADPERILNYLPERAIEAWRLYRRHFA